VLDLGAGEGLLSAALAQCGATVWATDAVPKQIWAAAEHHQQHRRLDLHFVIADAMDLPFGDGAFDLVVANLVLHHIEPPGPLLAEVLRVLRPGGRFAAFEPTPLIGALVHEQTSENEAPIAPSQVLSALGEAGFEDARTGYFWSRLETAALGPLSPGYRVSARKPGEGQGPAEPVLRRALRPMELPGLSLDGGCSFAELALTQERQILEILQSRRTQAG
jgi:SAM-dependent methyltransferase